VAATLPLVTYAPHLAPELLALAATQRGVFTGEQARAAGHSQNEIQRLRRHRHLVSVRRGAYALREAYEGAEAPEKHRMAVAALSLVLTAPAVLSHETAAVELGLELLQPDLSLLHVARPEAAGSREEAGVKHHCAELPEDQVVRRGGELEDAMVRCRSWPGARLASGALPIADGRAANPGESWSRVILVQHGLAPTTLQVPVHDEDGLIGVADFGWEGVLGELDGRGKYGIGFDTDPEEAGRIVWREKVREDRFRRQGFEVVRWTFAEHYRPGVIAARVRAALERAAARGDHPHALRGQRRGGPAGGQTRRRRRASGAPSRTPPAGSSATAVPSAAVRTGSFSGRRTSRTTVQHSHRVPATCARTVNP
jgi:hypothetical protein